MKDLRNLFVRAGIGWKGLGQTDTQTHRQTPVNQYLLHTAQLARR